MNEACGVRGYDMVCIRPSNHDGKHRGVSIPGRKEPSTVWWEPAEFPLIGESDV